MLKTTKHFTEIMFVQTVIASILSAAFAFVTTDNAGLVPFDRFFVIVFENKDYRDVMADNYFGTVLPQKGRLLTNYEALAHPSQANYIGMISGSTHGVKTDSTTDIDGDTIVDKLEEQGLTWTTYQEDYAGNCDKSSSMSGGLYKRKHNPFISFTSISRDEKRCSNIVNSERLYDDIKSNSVPEYVFYTPNMDHDGHDTDLHTSSTWLEGFLEPLFKEPAFANTLFLVTFDETESYMGRNIIYSVLLGNPVAAGSTDNTHYTHYSHIATLTKYWGIGSLKYDSKAAPFSLK